MPSIYALKPGFQRLLRPLASSLTRAGVTANQVTLLTGGLSVAIGLLTVEFPRLLLALPVFLFLRMAMNAVDGMMAREFGQKSDLGACLNELSDVISDAFLYLPFAYLPAFDPLWIGAVIVLSAVSEMAGIAALTIGAGRRYDGPVGKSDRAFVFGAMAAWIGFGGSVPRLAGLLFPRLIALLLAATIVNRVRSGLAEKKAGLKAGRVADANTNMRTPDQRFFITGDGTRLFYRYWPPVGDPSGHALVLFHRGHEHSGRLQHVVDELDLPAMAMFAWDARGHGRSAEPSAGAPTMGTLVKDVDTFVHHISSEFGIPIEDIAALGQSVGSVLVAAWVHDYAPPIRCMVLAAPAFSVKLYIPFARTALALVHRLAGDFHVNSYVRPSALTHDPARIASYAADPLIRRPIPVNILLALYSTATRVVEDAQAIETPAQVLISGADFVVHLGPQNRFFDRLGSKVKEKHVFDGFYHDTLGERDRGPAIAKVRSFLEKCFSHAVTAPCLASADRAGYTKDEFDRLSRPLPALSPKALNFGLTRIGMRTGGRLSDGIRLGLATGFDSGSTLDYVYRNKPSGITPLGKLIDWFYLNAIGWRGIRVRKQNIERLLRQAMAALRDAGLPVRIADIAAGHGRYVLEAIEGHGERPERILLRDFSEVNVREGAQLIRQKGMESIAHFEQGDAFDRVSVAAMKPRPTLGVVSGLYELFPENGPVRESLTGLAAAIEPGGYLIYTGQPWHPQLEMIARTLPSHRDHQLWIMRRRAQREIDQLVQAAGFRKIEQLADDHGIFTVSLTKRIGD